MKIEKNIPLPEARMGGKCCIVDAMEIGDSLEFDDHSKALSCYSKITYRGWKAAIRTIENEDGKPAYRVWRIQ